MTIFHVIKYPVPNRWPTLDGLSTLPPALANSINKEQIEVWNELQGRVPKEVLFAEYTRIYLKHVMEYED